jgi:protein pelota
MTITRARIEVNIPRKRRGAPSGHDGALRGFYDQLLRAIVSHVDLSAIKVVALASPAFFKDDFWRYALEEAGRREDLKPILTHRSKFILAHCTSGHRHSVAEVLSDPENAARLADTKSAKETAALQAFFKILASEEPSRAFYGYSHVNAAASRFAVKTLMVSDTLFRSHDLRTRAKYVALVDFVKDNNGEVLVFSSMHPSGEQLTQFSGIAAILNFPLPDIDEMDIGDLHEIDQIIAENNNVQVGQQEGEGGD